jgi:hypothetical protein
MPLSEVQREMTAEVVERFLKTKGPTPQLYLAKKFNEPDALEGLMNVVLISHGDEQLWPRALAFANCGNAENLRTATNAVEQLIRIFQDLFADLEIQKVEFTIAELQARGQVMFGAIEQATIQLGLYFIREINGILIGLGGSFPDFNYVKLNQRIGTIKNVPGVWDTHIAAFSLYLKDKRVVEPNKNADDSASGLTNGDLRKKTTIKARAKRGAKAKLVHPDGERWDLFISHASEDKDAIARPLYEALVVKGLKPWYDEISLKVGDGLRESIDRGLSRSKYGAVILSKHFFAKHWPKKELDGLATREVGGTQVILPVWHEIDFDEVRAESPTLANRVAAKTSEGLENVVAKLLHAIGWRKENAEFDASESPIVYGHTDDLHVGTRVYVLESVPGTPRDQRAYGTEIWVIREVDKEKNRATATPVLPPFNKPTPFVAGPMSGADSPFKKAGIPS